MIIIGCDFHTRVHIKTFLARFLILITKGRISPHRASVLAYVTSQLLHSQRDIARNNLVKPKEEDLVLDFTDWPDPPDASGLKGPACYVRTIQAGHLPDPRKKSSLRWRAGRVRTRAKKGVC